MYQQVVPGLVDYMPLLPNGDDDVVEYIQIEFEDDPEEDLEEEPEYQGEDIEEEFEEDTEEDTDEERLGEDSAEEN